MCSSLIKFISIKGWILLLFTKKWIFFQTLFTFSLIITRYSIPIIKVPVRLSVRPSSYLQYKVLSAVRSRLFVSISV